MTSANEINNAIKAIFEIENIQTRDQLNEWCGGSQRDKLYQYVQLIAPKHWARIHAPKESVRYYSQKIVSGYKRSRLRSQSP